MDGSLTRRIAALEARNDIVDLIVAYFERVDARDIEGLVELFAPAAELLAPGHPLRGHAEIRAFYTWRLPQFEFTNHYPHAETVIFEDENLARGTITGHAEHLQPRRATLSGQIRANRRPLVFLLPED